MGLIKSKTVLHRMFLSLENWFRGLGTIFKTLQVIIMLVLRMNFFVQATRQKSQVKPKLYPLPWALTRAGGRAN